VAPLTAAPTVPRDTVKVAERDTSAPITPTTPPAPQPHVVEQAPVASVAPPPATPAASSAVPPAPVTSATPTPAQKPEANPRADVADAIAGYARAIGTRDIAEVRRAYPGLTTDQQKGFEQFFHSVHSLRVEFAVSDMSVTDTTAQAHVSGAYEFEDGDGKPQRQPVTFLATLRRDGGAWRLLSVR
jgi:serine/threonine-protein kinase